MDAIVIGGGIGGSVLALALHASSVTHRIRVFEAASEMRALGIGIHIGAHAMKELSALGLEDALVATSCQPEDYAFFTRHGQLVYREPWASSRTATASPRASPIRRAGRCRRRKATC